MEYGQCLLGMDDFLFDKETHTVTYYQGAKILLISVLIAPGYGHCLMNVFHFQKNNVAKFDSLCRTELK